MGEGSSDSEHATQSRAGPVCNKPPVPAHSMFSVLMGLGLAAGASAQWQEIKTAHTPPARTVVSHSVSVVA
jgi:hypothetical protein